MTLPGPIVPKASGGVMAEGKQASCERGSGAEVVHTSAKDANRRDEIQEIPMTKTLSEAERLLPCPFCGRQPETFVRHAAEDMPHRFVAFAYCHGDRYSAHAHHFGTGDTLKEANDAAAAAWNLRTPHVVPGEEELVLLMRQNLSVDVSNYGLSADIEGIEDAARAILSRLTASRTE